MLGAIIGDIVGSVYEFHNHKSANFLFFKANCRFTDDTVMTLAVAEAVMNGGREADYIAAMRRLGALYPDAGYGKLFSQWLTSEEPKPYGSYGNGSAMRVSPVAWVAGSVEEAVRIAANSAKVTHDHPEGIKGAQAVAAAIYIARTEGSKDAVRRYIEKNYYPLGFTLDKIRPTYAFDATCQGSVPQAIEAFLESEDLIDAVRLAISIGGDSDTIAAMAGSIAEGFYGLPGYLRLPALGYLDTPLTDIIDRWDEYMTGK